MGEREPWPSWLADEARVEGWGGVEWTAVDQWFRVDLHADLDLVVDDASGARSVHAYQRESGAKGGPRSDFAAADPHAERPILDALRRLHRKMVDFPTDEERTGRSSSQPPS